MMARHQVETVAGFRLSPVRRGMFSGKLIGQGLPMVFRCCLIQLLV